MTGSEGQQNVGEISESTAKGGCNGLGDMMRRMGDHVGRCAMGLGVQGKRGRRPKIRWLGSVGGHLRDKRMSGKEVHERAAWIVHQ